MSLLSIEDIVVEFPTRRGPLEAVKNLTLNLEEGQILGLVGESGAGKSITAAAITGLIEPPGYIRAGQILLDGKRIDNLPREQMRRIRGRQIGSIFQDPLTSLNPVYTVGEQLVDTMQVNLGLSKKEARVRGIKWLTDVGIPAPELRFNQYPHQFSGGMRQRVVIALALCSEPKLIIADEPTTALDVSVQAQILALLRRLCREHNTAVVLVTHDMGVIAETADRVVVMYAGRLVEIGDVAQVIKAPLHPYSRGLMNSIPQVGAPAHRLTQIAGAMPGLRNPAPGCAFAPRCSKAMEICSVSRPSITLKGDTRVACFLYEGDEQ
ncbi:ABC transporter ATP-binding protein [Parasedimentitalea psychrophila]|uniref:ABC transporter ATP-binding protein n=1 Tax=Parasedimentitalea psychrophila TaxID=2997337 RepID=A0A9Y2L0B7_9RHOB|nr:ABC transporter ATP-binding protein [Parasedimentitalea psychrophila]WIY25823.1 ABC transporter ATP-binding protein [Parasedimentitalea psychrophila]